MAVATSASIFRFTTTLSPQLCSLRRIPWHSRPQSYSPRLFSQLRSLRDQQPQPKAETARAEAKEAAISSSSSSDAVTGKAPSPSKASSPVATSDSNQSLPPGWEDDPNFNISAFSQLPHKEFGYNQHMVINEEFKEALRQVLWQFRAPIRYAFAYGSGVFHQTAALAETTTLTPHPHPPDAVVKWQKGGGKMIDFIFGVTYTQHWHSLNLTQHPDHYSFLGKLGSGLVSRVQDKWGAGVYFNPYITVNGILIKYGVVNLDTLCKDLSEWNTLYLAGRLQKPVKILRDDPRVRLANQINLISALRTALLMLGPTFTEKELYSAIAGISYLGDPRMSLNLENTKKVENIVSNQMTNFRQLYRPLIEDLPNVNFNDLKCKQSNWADDPTSNCKLVQDMDPQKRGNMVRRLPKQFRQKLYFQYQKKFQIPGSAFDKVIEESKNEDATSFKRPLGGEFDQRIAGEDDLRENVAKAIKNTISWPCTSQSIKSFFTAGPQRSWRYLQEKSAKNKESKNKPAEKKSAAKEDKKE